MPSRYEKLRQEARRLFLTGELSTNAEIAARLGIKRHTVGEWKRSEDWDGFRRKIDRRAAEMFVEKIATDRVTLNLRHYRYWDLVIASLGDQLKTHKGTLDIKELERVASILDRAQKGQRLAKGLSIAGQTEETIRAQSQAEIRRAVETVIDAVKENISDEETRDRIGQAILAALPEEPGTGSDDNEDPVAH